MKQYLILLRPHQWIKNVLVFLPAITAWYALSLQESYLIFSLFVAMSLLASVTYIINDVLDIKSDKAHPETSKRPLASGALSAKNAFILASGLVGIVFSICLVLPLTVSGLLILYAGMSITYSLFLKKIPILDLCLLSGFYVIRIIMGLVLLNLDFSIWLLAFAFFFFFSIGLIKRCNELRLLHQSGLTHQRRGYSFEDYGFLQNLGVITGIVSVVIFTNYINSQIVMDLYTSPIWLIGISAALLYGMIRIWFLQHKQAICYDPVLFFINDPVSYCILSVIALCVFLAHH